jgi:hypothetical protein
MSQSISAQVGDLPIQTNGTHITVHVVYYEVNNGYNGTDTSPLILTALSIPLTASLLNTLIRTKVADAVNTWLGTSYTFLDVILWKGCTDL